LIITYLAVKALTWPLTLESRIVNLPGRKYWRAGLSTYLGVKALIAGLSTYLAVNTGEQDC
jgi:hypothetical protein